MLLSIFRDNSTNIEQFSRAAVKIYSPRENITKVKINELIIRHYLTCTIHTAGVKTRDLMSLTRESRGFFAAAGGKLADGIPKANLRHLENYRSFLMTVIDNHVNFVYGVVNSVFLCTQRRRNLHAKESARRRRGARSINGCC